MGTQSEYWRRRFQELEEKQYQRSVAYYQDLQEQFRRAKNEIQMDLERWYQRLAENNGISLAAAKRLLKKDELEEFHWTVEEYIKKGKENAINQRWMRELENASVRHHISYLEAMKWQIQQHAELLFTEYEGGVTDFLHRSYTESYYHAAYEIAKGTGIGSNLAELDERKIDQIIKKPWAQDGTNFSERIWANREKLVNQLHTELSQHIIRGEDPKKAIHSLAHTMEVSQAQAGRLVMTESAAIAAAAQKDCFQELEVERFQIVATLDSITCGICQGMDGKVFHMKEFEVGLTVPPYHPNCRCCEVPYFEDEFTVGEQRAARDEKGKTYYVPANMTYSEWKETFVESIEKTGIQNKDTDVSADMKKLVRNIKKGLNRIGDLVTRNQPPITLEDLKIDSTLCAQSIQKVIVSAPKSFQEVIFQNADKIIFAKTNAVGLPHFNSEQGIYINVEKDFVNTRGQWTTLFHEMGHNIDDLYGKPSQDVGFINALKEDFFRFTKVCQEQYNLDREEAYRLISKELRDATDEESHIFSDLFEGLSDGKCIGRWKHGSDYWNDGKIGGEAFAHFFSASVTKNKKKLKFVQAIFPEAYAKFLSMVGDMV